MRPGRRRALTSTGVPFGVGSVLEECRAPSYAAVCCRYCGGKDRLRFAGGRFEHRDRQDCARELAGSAGRRTRRR